MGLCRSEIGMENATVTVELSPQHLAAVNRRRRVVVNFDVIHGDPAFTTIDPGDLVKMSFTFADDKGSHIDSIWWNWGEGHQAPYPSRILPLYDHPGYQKWVADGIDIMRVFLEATHERGLEAFHSYRVNGSDNDLGPVAAIPMKRQHPDWLIAAPWAPQQKIYWNFELAPVREHKLSVLREVAENYDFDGIEIDFARAPITLPVGHQWECRHHLTAFMRDVRIMTLKVAEKRGRPLLLAARVPENLEGCHIDGIDIETWARERLLDIIVMGCRSYDVAVGAFRRITAKSHIKLYGGSDEHHTTGGYDWPPIEVLRGVFANWWRQGADGIYCFNWTYALPEDADRVGALLHDGAMAPVHRQLYHEIGDPAALKHQDKTFVVQRRGGGGSGAPDTAGWVTPRFFANTNMLAPLPAQLDNDGKADTLLMLFVAADLDAQADQIKDVTLRMILHDGAGEYVDFCSVPRHHHGPDGQITYDSSPDDPPLPVEGRIERALISLFKNVNHCYNFPPVKGIEKHVGVRINNGPLGEPSVENGWLVFRNIDPALFAPGNNLVGVHVAGRTPDARAALSIEKLEVRVSYR